MCWRLKTLPHPFFFVRFVSPPHDTQCTRLPSDSVTMVFLRHLHAQNLPFSATGCWRLNTNLTTLSTHPSPLFSAHSQQFSHPLLAQKRKNTFPPLPPLKVEIFFWFFFVSGDRENKSWGCVNLTSECAPCERTTGLLTSFTNQIRVVSELCVCFFVFLFKTLFLLERRKERKNR